MMWIPNEWRPVRTGCQSLDPRIIDEISSCPHEIPIFGWINLLIYCQLSAGFHHWNPISVDADMPSLRHVSWLPIMSFWSKNRGAGDWLIPSIIIYLSLKGFFKPLYTSTNQWEKDIHDWLVVYLPLWKLMEFISWDDDIPNWMEIHNPFMFQTTNQCV